MKTTYIQVANESNANGKRLVCPEQSAHFFRVQAVTVVTPVTLVTGVFQNFLA
jgi:hypothetical protein